MYSPPPDEAAEALARDPIDPVEETERFLEDAAADTDQPGKDEILCVRCVECRTAALVRRTQILRARRRRPRARKPPDGPAIKRRDVAVAQARPRRGPRLLVQ